MLTPIKIGYRMNKACSKKLEAEFGKISKFRFTEIIKLALVFPITMSYQDLMKKDDKSKLNQVYLNKEAEWLLCSSKPE